MGYLHIDNLYKLQDILMFKECYALEKIHGSSAHVAWDGTQLTFFAGGESHDNFLKIFNADALKAKFTEMVGAGKKVTVYGEVYGGKCQGMSETYGKVMKFVAFDVNIEEHWLDVPTADDFVKNLGLEFVHWVKISTDLKEIDAQRDTPSIQAIRNGISQLVSPSDGVVPDGATSLLVPGLGLVINPKKREGVVLRPIVELTKNNGSRIICKHKGDDFKETKTARPVVDPTKMLVLADAQKVADEWVTATRLQHVLDKLPGHSLEGMRDIIAAMVEDVLREGSAEIVDSEAVRKAIGRKTAVDYKNYLKAQIGSQ
jgi:hypothetical protein